MKASFYFPPEYVPAFNDPGAWLEPEIVPHHHTGHCGTAENWIYQSWARLKRADYTSTLSLKIPSQGVFFALGSSLGKQIRIPAGMCLVDIVADATPHPAAHAYIVQNRIQQKYIPNSFFIPHWPQPKMIPRSPDRGRRFENIAFFGDPCNLASELQQPEWQDHLRRSLGLSFTIKPPIEWNNYSQVDAVVAIRSFSQSRYLSKPATKLYNAWLAGVPFIGGHDIAYADEGNPGKNYLVATSPEELLSHLHRLKEDELLRDELVANGHHQGSFYTQQKTEDHWKLLLKEPIAKLAHTHVRKTPRQLFFMFQKHRFFSWAYRQRERYELF
jgi:hypothetical protein